MDDFTALTERAADGDRGALEELLEHCLPELRAFVRLRAGPIIRRRENESDIVQSVCRELLEKGERFRHPGEGAFKRWLYTTALRKILNRRDHHAAVRRDARREQSLGEEHVAHARLLETYTRFTSPSGRAIVAEEIERIESAMATLTDEQREAITLAHIVGLSRAEIAETMGKSEGAVRNVLHRGMAALGIALSD